MAGTASGHKSGCEAEKCLGLLFVAENFDETLELISVSVWAAIDATIHQDAEFGRRLVALVEQLIETVKRQFNGDFHLPESYWFCPTNAIGIL